MDHIQEISLAEEIEQQPSRFRRGYEFSYDHPGIFTFTNGRVAFCVSIDTFKQGELAIEVFEYDTTCIWTKEIPYDEPLRLHSFMNLIDCGLQWYSET